MSYPCRRMVLWSWDEPLQHEVCQAYCPSVSQPSYLLFFITGPMLNLSCPGVARGLHTVCLPTFRHSVRRTKHPLFRIYIRQFSTHLSTAGTGTRPPPPYSDRSSGLPVALIAFTSAAIGFGAALYFTNTNANLSKPDTPQFGSTHDIQNAISDLKTTFGPGSKVSTHPDDLHDHGFSPNDHHPGESWGKFCMISDWIYFAGMDHSVVVYPESTDDVVKIVNIATKYRIPITAYSGATSLEGHYRGVGFHWLILRSLLLLSMSIHGRNWRFLCPLAQHGRNMCRYGQHGSYNCHQRYVTHVLFKSNPNLTLTVLRN